VDVSTGIVNWLTTNQTQISRSVRRYLPVVQILTGVFLALLGYSIGKDHLTLIQHGVRTPGVIVNYQTQIFRDARRNSSTTGFMPIVQFRDADRTIQFKDWLGSSSTAFLGQRVTVLYDPANPSVAMIDRSIANWIPWGPTIAVGVFLVCVGLVAAFKSQTASAGLS
jgi:Protein of unknown function (DUF3592)